MVPHGRDSLTLSASDISLRDLLTVVFKRRWLIAVFAVAVVALALLITLLGPPTYQAEATLLVNTARAEIPIAPRDSSQLIIGKVGEEELNSEIEILKSRQLVEEVLDSLGQQTVPQKASWLGTLKTRVRSLLGGQRLTRREAMTIHLQSEIRVTGVRRSNVIKVSYRSKDAAWATDVVKTLIDKYLAKRAEMYRSPQAVAFFEEQMRDAEQQLAETEATLEQFLESAGITMVRGPQGSDALSAQKGLVLERLARAKNDLSDAEIEVEEGQLRVASIRERLEREPVRLESSNRYNQDAASEEIEKALAALELERDRLLQDFKPDSRFVKDIDTQIRLARKRLEELDGERGSIDQTEVNPVHQQLKSDLLRAESDLDGATGKLLSLQQQVADLEGELGRLNEQGFELEKLRRDSRAAEEAYLLFRKKHEEARISAAMDQQKFINVSVAQPAQKPLRPIPRRLKFNMMLALAFGILGGLSLAFGIEFYLDHTFTTGEEMERRLGLTHLASIPEEA